jgi:ribulose kinase
MADRRSYEASNGSGGNVLGAAILGALAGAAAVFFSDPKNRDKVKDKANKIMSDGKETLQKAEDTTRRKAVKKLEEEK